MKRAVAVGAVSGVALTGLLCAALAAGDWLDRTQWNDWDTES